jgi:nicotinamidase-related amidase
LILGGNDIETLIVFGIATSDGVLSTLREAADADYRLVVIKGCCTGLDQKLRSCARHSLPQTRASPDRQ